MVKFKTNPNAKMEEDWKDFSGTTVLNLPFPKDWTDEQLKNMKPIIVKWPITINYIHTYGQDSPWFAALSNGELIGTKCKECGFTTANPKLACQECTAETEWVKLPKEGKVHAFTACHYGGEAFLDEIEKNGPFVLIMVEFEGVDTLLMSRLIGVDSHEASLDWIGMKIKAKFAKLSQISPTDVYFVPAE